MSDDAKARAIEVFRTFGEKVASGEATGDDFGEFRQGLRSVAEDLELDLSAYDENLKPTLDEAQENFEVEAFKQRVKGIVQKVCEYFEIDPEQLRAHLKSLMDD